MLTSLRSCNPDNHSRCRHHGRHSSWTPTSAPPGQPPQSNSHSPNPQGIEYPPTLLSSCPSPPPFSFVIWVSSSFLALVARESFVFIVGGSVHWQAYPATSGPCEHWVFKADIAEPHHHSGKVTSVPPTDSVAPQACQHSCAEPHWVCPHRLQGQLVRNYCVKLGQINLVRLLNLLLSGFMAVCSTLLFLVFFSCVIWV